MSATAVPTERAALRKVLSHLLLPLLMCLGMGLAYQSAFHAPAPRHMKVAVVGSTPQADVLARTIEDRAGDALDVSTVPTADAARAQLMDRALVAAYVPSATAPQLIVASAGSVTDVDVAQKVFTQVAAAQHLPLGTVELTPLPAQDPTNQALFFLLVALSIGSYGSVAVIGGAGAALRVRTRAGLGVGVSFVIAAMGAALAGPVFHFVHHDLAGVFALAWVYSFAIVAIGTALHRLLGRWTTLGTMLLFVMLNFTSSGGIYRPDLQNGFFGALHSFWIGSGFVEGSRSLLYFDGRAGFAGYVWILVGWALVGALALAATAAAERRGRPAPALAAESESDADEEREEAVAV